MAGPTVEELLRAGGVRRSPPQVGAGETFVNRAVNAIPFGRPVVDALSAAALEFGSSGGTRATLTPQAQAELEAMGEKVATPEGLLERYRQVRDRRAQRTELGSEQNPWAGGVGTAVGIGLTALAPLPKAAGTGLPAAAKTGAAYGAIEGLTGGQADLTRGEFGEALGETARGALFGAGAGALGQGLVNLGRRGVQALRGAREEVLAQESVAAREGAEEAQAKAAKVFEKERREVGQAREMNKAFDKKRAKEVLQRARGGRQSAPGGTQDPSTKVLKGYSAQARQAQMSRSKEVERLQQKINDPRYPTKVTEDWQAYIDEMPKAMETGPHADPGGLRRQFMERHLRQAYGDEVAERVMRERVGPGGEILPRPASPADEVTAVGDAFDAARRGDVRAGGGGSAWDAYTSSGRTISALPEELPGAVPRTSLPGQPPVLGPPPTPRPGAQGMPYGQNLRPPPQAPAAPQGTPTAPLRPPTPQPPASDVQDVTRLAGPEDVAQLAAERASAREARGFSTLGRAAYEGVKEGGIAGATLGAVLGQAGKGAVIGSILGGGARITKTLLQDPAVRARALAAARLHLLQRINPELFARVGGTLTAAAARGESEYRARKYLEMRRNPELREAEQQAAEEAARLSDEQLLELLSGAPAQP